MSKSSSKATASESLDADEKQVSTDGSAGAIADALQQAEKDLKAALDLRDKRAKLFKEAKRAAKLAETEVENLKEKLKSRLEEEPFEALPTNLGLNKKNMGSLARAAADLGLSHEDLLKLVKAQEKSVKNKVEGHQLYQATVSVKGEQHSETQSLAAKDQKSSSQ
jgi:uncharacterized protein YajQ (UPF0234 family)